MLEHRTRSAQTQQISGGFRPCQLSFEEPSIDLTYATPPRVVTCAKRVEWSPTVGFHHFTMLRDNAETDSMATLSTRFVDLYRDLLLRLYLLKKKNRKEQDEVFDTPE